MWPGLKLTSLSDSIFRSLFRVLFRYDIFISYARGDGKDYAIKLRDQLKQLDFSCFLDFDELPPGNSLNNTLKKAIRKSATLVIVGTDRAVKSRYVELEVSEFANTGRAIVPIDIEGSLADVPWAVIKERDIVWIDEVKTALGKGVPSPSVADSIDKLFKYTRRNSRVRAQVFSTMILFALIVAVSLFLIQSKVKAANLASVEAVRQTGIAKEASENAKEQQRLAGEATAKANIAEDSAKAAEVKQKKAEKSAIASAENAKKQERIALANADKAKAQQARAEERTRYVSAQQMGVQADLNRDSTFGFGLEGSLLLAIESLKLALTPEGYIAWQRGMELLPQSAEIELGKNLHNVAAVAYNDDGSLLATSGSDGSVSLLQTDKKTEPVPLPNQLKEPANMITFGTDGSWIAAAKTSGPGDKTRSEIAIWDLKTLQAIKPNLQNLPQISRAESIAFSPDGRYLAMADREKTARVIDLSTGALVALPTVEGTQYAMSVAFSSDGKHLAIGCIPGRIGIWEVAAFPKGIEANREPAVSVTDPGSIHEVVFSSEVVFRSPNYLAAVNNQGLVEIWEVSDEGETPTLTKNRTEITGGSMGISNLPVIFSRRADYIATLGDGSLHLWDLQSGREISRLHYGDSRPAIAFSPDGQLLVTASDDVKFWKMQFGSEVRRIPVHDNSSDEELKALALSPGGEYLVAASSDGARIFRTSDWTQLTTIGAGDSVFKLTFSADGQWLITASKDKVRVFDTKSWSQHKVIDLPAEDNYSLGFSPDLRWLVITSGVRVKLLEYGSWREQPLLEHSDDVKKVSFSPDGMSLAVQVAGDYRPRPVQRITLHRERTYLWDVKTSSPLACRTDKDETETTPSDAPAVGCPAIKGNGQQALLSQIPDWKEPVAFAGLTDASQDGSWEFIQVIGAPVLVHKVGKTGRQVASMLYGMVTASTFTRDNRWLVIADERSLMLWPLQTADMIDAACRRLHRHELTLDEWKEYFSGDKVLPTCAPTQP